MTVFDFDQPIDRREVPSLKTHRIVLGEGGERLFAAGVADMDFRVAPPILDTLQRRLDHGVFGYEAVPEGLMPALQDWLSRRHGWRVEADCMLRAPNALNALAIATSLFSAPGESVIVQPPVFFDFSDVIRDNGRGVARNPLSLREGRYEMDFEGLEALARDPRNRLLFLCNPHNPVGRAWTREELDWLSGICLRHGVLVVADELHGDLALPGNTYTPLAALGAEAADNSVTILSPAKTFNIASCCAAFTIVSSEKLRRAFQAENSRLTVNKNNTFANAAMEAAFRDGEAWLNAALDYLSGNLGLLRDRLSDMPGVSLIEPEATFLAWLDFRALGLANDELHAFLRSEARWALTRGSSFGTEGNGFMRLNFACRRERLSDALDDLSGALARL